MAPPMAERHTRRPWLVPAVALAAACTLATAGCSGGDEAAPQPTSTTPSVAPAAYGAYGTTTDDVFPETHTLSPAEARLVGPHFAVQFDKVSFTTRLSHAQAMNFGYFGDMDHGDMAHHSDHSDHSDHAEHTDHGDTGHSGHTDRGKQVTGPSVLAAPGHRFMVVHTVPVLPKLAPALPEYRNNIAPEDKVKGEIHVGGKTVPLPGIVRDLSTDHSILLSVPTGADPVLAVTDGGRTQRLNLRTGHREGPQTAAYYPVRTAAGPLGASVTGTAEAVHGGSVSLAVHSAAPSLQPYAEGRGWADKGKAWLYLGGDVRTQLAEASGATRLDAVLDPARSFTLTLPDGRTVRGAGTASTKEKLPLGVDSHSSGGFSGSGSADTAGEAKGALAVAFEVPDDFRSGTLRFTPEGTYAYGGKKTAYTVRDKAGELRITLR